MFPLSVTCNSSVSRVLCDLTMPEREDAREGKGGGGAAVCSRMNPQFIAGDAEDYRANLRIKWRSACSFSLP